MLAQLIADAKHPRAKVAAVLATLQLTLLVAALLA